MSAGNHRSVRPSRILLYIVLILAAGFFLMPVYILIVTSLKSYADVNLATMWSLPKQISLDSFLSAWNGDPTKGTIGLSNNFMNSMKLAIPATILSAIVGSLNGYVLAKWKFPGANFIFALILFGMFIPYQSILIPLMLTLQAWGKALRPLVEYTRLVVLRVADALVGRVAHQQRVGDERNVAVKLHLRLEHLVFDFISLPGLPARFRSAEIGGGFPQVKVQPVDPLRADVPLVESHIGRGGSRVGFQVAAPNAA